MVEDLAEVMIEELIQEHATELAQMCDVLGEQLFEEEFREVEA